MNDADKTKEQLIRELQELRQRNAALEQTVHDLTIVRQQLEIMIAERKQAEVGCYEKAKRNSRP